MIETIVVAALYAFKALALLLGMGAHGQSETHKPYTPEFTARVIHVDDGDTLIALRSDGQKTKVRLANIDAPEIDHGRCRPGQPFAEKSTQALKELAHGKDAAFICTTLDQYERHICDVQVNSKSVNRELARQGLAWANRARPTYLRDISILEAERDAAAARRGLWSETSPMEPWAWRRDVWGKGCQD